MATWLENAVANLLNRSLSHDLSTAMTEWNTTGGYEDTHSIDEKCELCEHEGLRYQFEIANSNTGSRLWVGSTCITKFIPLHENGIEVVGEVAKTALLQKRQREYEANTKEQRAILLLNELALINPSVFKHPTWRAKLGLGYSVKQLVMISAICNKHLLAFNAADFRINTRRDSNLRQLLDLEAWQYRRLRAALPKARQTQFDPILLSGS